MAVSPCNIANSNTKPGVACACLTGYKGTIKWVDGNPKGDCSPALCTGAQPANPANGKVSLSNSNRHGSKATFSCNAGFKHAGAVSITCDAKNADTAWPVPSSAASCTG